MTQENTRDLNLDAAYSDAAFESITIADLVEHLNSLDIDDATALLLRLPAQRTAAALDRIEFSAAADVLTSFPTDRAALLLGEMSADRAADLLNTLEEDHRAKLLAHVSPETRAALRRLLSHPQNTAGGMMTTEFVTMPDTATVAETIARIRAGGSQRAMIYMVYVYIVDREDRLVATTTLRRLIAAQPNDRIKTLAGSSKPIAVALDTDRHAVTALFRRHDLLAVPVVDRLGHILGIVTVDDIIDAIDAEDTEDVYKFAGVGAFDQPYLKIGFGAMIRKRAGWLSALFLSEMLTASVMQHFESELERAVVLTLFIPLIMSSGGNSGGQATSLLIRALALGQIHLKDWWRVALRELPTSLVLGLILGTIAVGRIALWQHLGFYDYGAHWLLIAATVGSGLVGIVTFGSMAGSMLPFVLQRLGFDPASASAPFVATLVDVTGLVIYFTVALAILSGTLL